MKALNNRSILLAYYRLSFYLILSVVIAISFVATYYKTTAAELSQIHAQAKIYEKTYLEQVELINEVDSIINYIILPDKNHYVNEVVLRNVIMKRRTGAMKHIDRTEGEDFILTKKILNDMDIFIELKDSIRLLKRQEDVLKNNIIRCISKKNEKALKISVKSGASVNNE